MELRSQNKVEMFHDAEKGRYVLSLPLGAPLEEALKVCATFTASLSKALEDYKKKKEEDGTADTDKSSAGSSEE
jgi:hypothetical protein